MNQLTLLVIVVVAFCYFGGKYCPSALKKNKELLLGVAGGLVLCSFFGLRLEGLDVGEICKADDQCNTNHCGAPNESGIRRCAEETRQHIKAQAEAQAEAEREQGINETVARICKMQYFKDSVCRDDPQHWHDECVVNRGTQLGNCPCESDGDCGSTGTCVKEEGTRRYEAGTCEYD